MNILFVNSVEPACGVHQFGLNLWRVLSGVVGRVPSRGGDAGSGDPAYSDGRRPTLFTYYYCAPTGDDELLAAIRHCEAGLVFYNFYPCTMQWLSLRTLTAVRALGLKQATIFHEVPVTGFDALLYPDPTFRDTSRWLTDWYWLGRFLPLPSTVAPRLRPVPVIGTAGFGFGWKGHARLVELVLKEFDKARIRLHLPFARHGDAAGRGALAVANQCRALVAGRPGIELEIDHEFMLPEVFVDWLAQNDLNAYLYDPTAGRGIASTVDHALAARRPIALTRVEMFRHLHKHDKLFIEENSLSEILARGIEPLQPVYEEFSDANGLTRVEQVLFEIGKPRTLNLEPRTLNGEQGTGETSNREPSNRRTLNRLLRDTDREHYAPLIQEMTAAVPEMMARKIPEANVQQAFCLDVVRRCFGGKAEKLKTESRVLCVGCFEDTAYETLLRSGEHVTGIDPALNWDLATYRVREPGDRFECVFACSVLEHVADDAQFFRDLCDCLIPDGVAILTCDYKADYQPGDPLPATDVRFYTPADIERLGKILTEQGCYWVDKPDLRGEPDFVYQGHHYSFLALVFKKL